MNIIDALNGIWTTILNVLGLFIIPDWNSVVAMLPVLILIGVVGPFLTFTMLGSVIYLVRKPRVDSSSRTARASPNSGRTACRSFRRACRTAVATP